MAPDRVVRAQVRRLTDLPNIGRAGAGDFQLLGFTHPEQICGQNPREMYERLGQLKGSRQDPCVLDVLTSVTEFLAGGPPRPWWEYSAQRKAGSRNAEAPSK